jgi:multiple sugar transport system permease protein
MKAASVNVVPVQHRHKSFVSQKLLWMFVLPALLLRGVTMLYPVLITFYNSFLDYRIVMRIKRWGGLSNYIKLFTDQAVRDTLTFTFIFTVFSMLFIIILGTFLGLLLNEHFIFRRFLRSIILIPWAMPTIVIGIAMLWGFNDTYGFVNDLISRLTGSPFNFGWLSNKNGARFAVILVDVWKNAPFFAIMVLAGLQTIPEELYEATRVDGGGPIQCFLHITLPHLQNTMVSMVLFFILWRISSFDLVYAMTSGGPGTATTLISYKLMMESVKSLNYGYASAIAAALFMVMVIIASLGMWLIRRRDR